MYPIKLLKSLKRKLTEIGIYFLLKVDAFYLKQMNPLQKNRFIHIATSRMPKIVNDLFMKKYSLVHETWWEFSQTIKNEVLIKPYFGFFRSPVIKETMTGLHYKKDHKLLIENIYDTFNENTSELLNEDACGEPLLLRNCNYKTSFTRVMHCYQAAKLQEITDLQKNKMIMEWGGGYGGLCRIVKKINPNITYVIVDLPCSIALQFLYLSTVLSEDSVEIFDGLNFSAGKIILVPSTDLEKIPESYSADIFVSSWALSESSSDAQKAVSDRKFFGAEKGLLIHQHSSLRHPHADDSAKLFTKNFNIHNTSPFPYFEDQTIIQGQINKTQNQVSSI